MTEKCATAWNRQFTKSIHDCPLHLKRCPIALSQENCKLTLQWDTTPYLPDWWKFQSLRTNSFGRVVKELAPLRPSWWMINYGTSSFEGNLAWNRHILPFDPTIIPLRNFSKVSSSIIWKTPQMYKVTHCSIIFLASNGSKQSQHPIRENKSKTKTKTKKNTVYTQGVPMCAEPQNLQEKSLCSAIVICWIFY